MPTILDQDGKIRTDVEVIDATIDAPAALTRFEYVQGAPAPVDADIVVSPSLRRLVLRLPPAAPEPGEGPVLFVGDFPSADFTRDMGGGPWDDHVGEVAWMPSFQGRACAEFRAPGNTGKSHVHWRSPRPWREGDVLLLSTLCWLPSGTDANQLFGGDIELTRALNGMPPGADFSEPGPRWKWEAAPGGGAQLALDLGKINAGSLRRSGSTIVFPRDRWARVDLYVLLSGDQNIGRAALVQEAVGGPHAVLFSRFVRTLPVVGDDGVTVAAYDRVQSGVTAKGGSQAGRLIVAQVELHRLPAWPALQVAA